MLSQVYTVTSIYRHKYIPSQVHTVTSIYCHKYILSQLHAFMKILQQESNSERSSVERYAGQNTRRETTHI